MHKKHTLIIAQLFISLMMGCLMTGIFSLLELGFSLTWLHAWAKHFLLAWPVAFCLSLVVGNIGFKLAEKVTA